VRALELSGNPDAIAALSPLTTDPDSAVRQAAVAALAFIGPADLLAERELLVRRRKERFG
jgi:HEAT repeat protein